MLRFLTGACVILLTSTAYTASDELARVAILPATDRTGTNQFQWLQRSLPDAIDKGMKDNFEYKRVDEAKASAAATEVMKKRKNKVVGKRQAKKIAKESKADILIFASYTFDKSTQKVTIKPSVYLLQDKKSLKIKPIVSKSDDTLFKAVEQTSREIVKALDKDAGAAESKARKAGKKVKIRKGVWKYDQVPVLGLTGGIISGPYSDGGGRFGLFFEYPFTQWWAVRPEVTFSRTETLRGISPDFRFNQRDEIGTHGRKNTQENTNGTTTELTGGFMYSGRAIGRFYFANVPALFGKPNLQFGLGYMSVKFDYLLEDETLGQIGSGSAERAWVSYAFGVGSHYRFEEVFTLDIYIHLMRYQKTKDIVTKITGSKEPGNAPIGLVIGFGVGYAFD